MRVVIAPDSFKGSLAALQAAQAMAAGVRRVWPDAEIHLVPMADGGEGTLDAVLSATPGVRLSAEVAGMDGQPLWAEYGLLDRPDGAVAVIEVARLVGLTLPSVAAVPVARRTTRGVGELVRQCLDRGVRRFWIGLGGSATNDGGAGLLAALGVGLLDERGEAIAPDPDGLAKLIAVDFSLRDPRLKESEIVLLSDVDNPLLGDRGATAVFGLQKGVRPDEVAEFDRRLRRLAALCGRWYGQALSQRPGTGAAGGLGYALRLLGGRHLSGAEAVAELLGLDQALAGAAWAITGEGRSDGQTFSGKAPWVVARHGRQQGVPVTLISGDIDPAALSELASRFDGCLALAAPNVPLQRAMTEASNLLSDRAEQAARCRVIT